MSLPKLRSSRKLSVEEERYVSAAQVSRAEIFSKN
jgi:hypothetical protein